MQKSTRHACTTRDSSPSGNADAASARLSPIGSSPLSTSPAAASTQHKSRKGEGGREGGTHLVLHCAAVLRLLRPAAVVCERPDALLSSLEASSFCITIKFEAQFRKAHLGHTSETRLDLTMTPRSGIRREAQTNHQTHDVIATLQRSILTGISAIVTCCC